MRFLVEVMKTTPINDALFVLAILFASALSCEKSAGNQRSDAAPDSPQATAGSGGSSTGGSGGGTPGSGDLVGRGPVRPDPVGQVAQAVVE